MDEQNEPYKHQFIMLYLIFGTMDDILKALVDGTISLEEAGLEIEKRLYGEEEFNIDIGRHHRTGIPEVVIAEGKRQTHLLSISLEFLQRNGRLLVSRIEAREVDALLDHLRTSGMEFHERYEEEASFLTVWTEGSKVKPSGGKIGILTAGTSDIPVAREAEAMAREMGCEVMTFNDIGVAGVHRIWGPLKKLKEWDPDVLIVAAGREGALPTLVSGLTDIPVVGLPVSTGYGLHGKGETALFAMLQSCSPLMVVNIDAGFVAGAVAARIANHRK